MPSESTVLYVCTEDWYFENHRFAHAVALIDSGFDVHVLCRSSGAPTERLERAGVTVHPMEMARGSSPLSLVGEVSRVRAVIRRVRPDVVHCIALKTAVVGALLVPTARCGFIFAVAGFGLSSVERSTVSRAAVLLLRMTSLSKRVRVLFQNTSDRDHVSPFRGNDRLIESVGVDLGDFRKSAAQPFDVNTPVRFCFLGRPVRSKGLLTLVDLDADAEKIGFTPEFHLHLSHDPDSPGALSSDEIEALRGCPHVVVHPPTNAPAEALAAAHFGFLPSLAGEGVSKFSIETLACGRPLLTTSTPGNETVVEDGVHGVLFAPGSADDLHRALIECGQLLTDLDSVGSACRDRATEKFSLEKILPRVVALHEELA